MQQRVSPTTMTSSSHLVCLWDDCTASGFQTEMELYRHLKETHVDTGGTSRMTCLWRGRPKRNFCGLSVRNRHHLVDHIASHFSPSVKPFQCRFCPETFRHRQGFRSHEIQAHADIPQCKVKRKSTSSISHKDTKISPTLETTNNTLRPSRIDSHQDYIQERKDPYYTSSPPRPIPSSLNPSSLKEEHNQHKINYSGTGFPIMYHKPPSPNPSTTNTNRKPPFYPVYDNRTSLDRSPPQRHRMHPSDIRHPSYPPGYSHDLAGYSLAAHESHRMAPSGYSDKRKLSDPGYPRPPPRYDPYARPLSAEQPSPPLPYHTLPKSVENTHPSDAYSNVAPIYTRPARSHSDSNQPRPFPPPLQDNHPTTGHSTSTASTQPLLPSVSTLLSTVPPPASNAEKKSPIFSIHSLLTR